MSRRAKHPRLTGLYPPSSWSLKAAIKTHDDSPHGEEMGHVLSDVDAESISDFRSRCSVCRPSDDGNGGGRYTTTRLTNADKAQTTRRTIDQDLLGIEPTIEAFCTAAAAHEYAERSLTAGWMEPG